MRNLYLITGSKPIFIGTCTRVVSVEKENQPTIIAWDSEEYDKDNMPSLNLNEWDNHMHLGNDMTFLVLDHLL